MSRHVSLDDTEISEDTTMKRFAIKQLTALVLALVMTLSLCPVTAWADYAEPPSFGDTTTEETHSHPTCGVTGCTSSTHGHNEVDVWTELTSADLDGSGKLTLIDGNSYYLGEDITVTSAVITTGAVNLCLNGKSLSNASGDTLQVCYGDELVVCDCSSNNAGTISSSLRGIYCENVTDLTVYGGTISGKTGIYVGSGSNNAVVTINGGVVTGVSCGVELSGTGSTVTINGGTISGKPGVYAPNGNNSSEVYITGGTIAGITGTAVSVECRTYISGGAISGRPASGHVVPISTTASDSIYGITAGANDIYLSGAPSISGTTGGIKLNGKQIIVNGALTNTDPIGVTMSTVGVFAKPNGTNVTDLSSYADKFTSDNANYKVVADSSGNLELIDPTQLVTVSFNANGGSGTMADQTVVGSVATALNANTFTRQGYAFNGWNTRADGSGTVYADGVAITVNSHTTLYAQWEAAHSHLTCGVAGCTNTTHGHSMVEDWTELTSVGSTLSEGSYYLGKDITVNSTIAISGTVNLCLNGNTLSLADGKTGSVISVPVGATLKLCDCSNPSTGIITGGNARSEGGGIYVFGNLVIYGGTISENYAGYEGGGVFVNGGGGTNVASFKMYGGSITNNSANNHAGGVYLSNCTATLSGTPVISGNTSGDGSLSYPVKADNMYVYAYMSNGSYIPNADITVGDLADGASIGVGMTSPCTFTEGGADYVDYFTSDNDAYEVMTDGSGNLMLAKMFTVSFNANGGSGTMDSQTVIGGTATQLNANTFTSSDCTFNGWNTKADGSGTAYVDRASITVTRDTTLYAQWVETHAHHNCGVVGCTNTTHDHNAVDHWTKLTSADLDNSGNLTLASGNSYYLGEDITVSSTISITGAVNLCLNGKTLSLADGKTGSVISIDNGAMLNLCDCSNPSAGKITGGNAQNGGGVSLSGTGSFTMYSGSISGNKASDNGGGVFSIGTFTMNGGSISENTGLYGGGVYSYNIFTMTDGTISGNTANYGGGVLVDTDSTITGGSIIGNNADRGGGIYLSVNATMKLSGTPVITDNVAGGEFNETSRLYEQGSDGSKSNLYLNGNAAVTVNNELNTGANIGVMMKTAGVFAKPDGRNMPDISSYAGNFTSDNDAYVVAVDDDGNLKLVTKTVAVSSVTLDKTSMSITVGDTEQLTATVLPNNATDKTVTWSSDNGNVATVDSSGKVTAKNVGTANIIASAGDKTATCMVSVNAIAISGSVNLSGGEMYGSKLTATYTGNETVSYQWYRGDAAIDGATESTYMLTAADVGKTVKVVVSGTGNYQGSVSAQTTKAVEKATPDYEIPSNLTATYGQKLGNVTLPDGWCWDDAAQSVGNAGRGTFAATYTPEDTTNYNVVEARLSVTVEKAPLTVTAVDTIIYYGDAPANAGVSYDGFVNNETASVLDGTLDFTYSYAQYGNVGSSYTITPKGLTSDNYAITFTDGTLTVQQKVIGISWTNTALTYNSTAQKPTATATGVVNNDEVMLTVSGEQTNVGTHTATVSAISNSNYKLPAAKTTNFTISAKLLNNPTLTLDVSSFTYDGTEKKPTVVAVKDGDTPLTENSDYTIMWPADCTSVGPKTITVTFKGNYSGSAETSYSISYLAAPTSPYTINGAILNDGKYYTQGTVTLTAPSGYEISKDGADFSAKISFNAGGGKPANVYLKREADGAITDAIAVNEVFITDDTAPMITGIAEGQTYYGATTFEISDSQLASVTVDGKKVELTNGEYTLQPDNDSHTIVATDKAGNTTSVSITVYETYTVVYKNGSTTISTQTVNYGADAVEPALPQKSGYIGAWSDDGKNILRDTTITVVWTPILSGDIVRGNWDVALFTEKTGTTLTCNAPVAQWWDTLYVACDDVASKTVYLTLASYSEFTLTPENGGAAIRKEDMELVGKWSDEYGQLKDVYALTVQNPNNGSKTVSYAAKNFLTWEDGDGNPVEHCFEFTLSFDFAPALSGAPYNTMGGITFFSVLENGTLSGDNSLLGYQNDQGQGQVLFCRGTDEKTAYLAVYPRDELRVTEYDTLQDMTLERVGTWIYSGNGYQTPYRVYSLTVENPGATGSSANFIVTRDWESYNDNGTSDRYDDDFIESFSDSSQLVFDFSHAPMTALKITSQPTDVTTTAEGTAKFSVVASGSSLKYQWQFLSPGSKVWENNSCTSTTFSINQPGMWRNGYQYRCKITDGTTTVYSDVVTLTVE